MLLSDDDICRHITNGWIGIDPYDQRMVQPASIDVRLGNHIVHAPTWIDPGRIIEPDQDNGHLWRETDIADGESWLLQPKAFALGHTVETVTLSPRVAARLEGRSSWGRLGLVVHSTAGFIDPGFSGQITLELGNLSPYPIRLRPGLRIAQICFIPMVSPSTVPYGPDRGSKYHGQTRATMSRSARDEW